MSDGHKKRVEAAIYNWSKKQLPKKPRAKSNEKPEAEFVLQLKKHLTNLGWSMTIVEAKANFSEESQRYTSGAVAPGFPDMAGNTPNGIAAFIEVKAPGKRSTIRPAQRDFLISKISTNCFAICCDSIEYFDRVFSAWRTSQNQQSFLLHELPELSERWKKLTSDDLSFDEDP